MCKHDGGFKCLTNSAADRPPAAFYCEHGCGFFMNYDPVLAGTVRHSHWRIVGISYLNVPNERNWKKPLRIAISRF